MNDQTVCAVIVTYNRKKFLLECLKSLENQSRNLDAIYIVDNASTDGTLEVLQKYNYINSPQISDLSIHFEITSKKNHTLIHYVRMQENTGGAGGFYEGVKRAYEKGYDWLWLMDDDIRFDKSCLNNLLNYNSKYNVLVPLRLSIDGSVIEKSALKLSLSNPYSFKRTYQTVKDKFNKNNIPPVLEIKNFSFEGPLINRKIVKSIGFPDKQFFIFGDDTDYALRIRLNTKNKIIMITDSRLYRMIPNTKEDFNWKNYYMLRNHYYINYKYGKNIFVKYNAFIILIALIVYNLLKFNWDMYRFKIYYYATIDYLKNPMPNRFKP